MADDAIRPPRAWPVLAAAAIVSALLAAVLTVGFSTSGGDDDAVPDALSEPLSTSPGLTPSDGSEPPPDARLLPNVRSLKPTNISIEQVGSRRSLRFDGTLANVGVGPLEVVPDEEVPCPSGQRHVSQAIYQDADADGLFDATVDRTKTFRAAGCLLFHPEHTHWHLDASASYVLAATDGFVVVAQNKVSFCLRDNKRVPGAATAAAKATYGKCARDRLQGISIGWADVYKSDLAGQELKLPRTMSDGVYCLRVKADPLDLLVETNEGDNGSVSAIRIDGPNVAPAPQESCA